MSDRLSILASLALGLPGVAFGGDKALVCHRTGVPGIVTIEVSVNAVPAHLAHGDTLPATFWPDADHDGHGVAGASVFGCLLPQGYAIVGDDCDDTSASTYPGADETCDGVDQDCDGAADDGVPTTTWYADSDLDGWGDDASAVDDCAAPAGSVELGGDCDDASATTNPGALEECNDVDDDCDGTVDDGLPGDEVWWRDADGDGTGDPRNSVTACGQPVGYVDNHLDCDDSLVPAVADPGEVWFTDGSGVATDLSATFLAGAVGAPVAYDIPESGTLSFGEGTWYTTLSVEDVSCIAILGAGAPEDVVLSAERTDRVISIWEAVPRAIVAHLTLTNGDAMAGTRYPRGVGGGIMENGYGSILTLSDCVVTGNTTGAGGYQLGGGVGILGDSRNDGGLIQDCLITNNESERGGGVGVTGDGLLRIESSRISGNRANFSGGGVGFLWTGTPGVIVDTVISANRATYGGGGILANGDLDLDDVAVYGNTTTPTPGDAVGGGGLLADYRAVVTCASSHGLGGFWSNTTARRGGGAYVAPAAVLTSEGCDWGNGATENHPDDVWSAATTSASAYGADAWFTCDSAGCAP